MEKEIIRGKYYFLNDGGETGELIRSFDWSQTEIGEIDQWPHGLRTTLSLLLHSAFPMFLFWGKELRCFYNDAFRQCLGVDGKHPAIGKPAKEVWPEIWHIIEPLIEKVLTTGKPVWFEDMMVPFYRNGRMEDMYWTFSYSPAYGDDGGIGGVFVTCTETTSKVHTIKKLVESERRFQNLVHGATVGIMVLTGDEMRVEIVNNGYARLVGRKCEELIGKPLYDVIETEPYLRLITENVRATGESRDIYDYPYFVWVDGEKKAGFINIIYQPYKEDNGTIGGVMILCQDVTEQVLARITIENSEQRIRSFVESAPFPIGVYIGKEMRIEFANQALIDVWGKGNDILGKLYHETLPELDPEIFHQLDGVFTTGVPFHAKNQRVDLVVDGVLRIYYFNYSFTPLLDVSGRVYGVMNTAADVTDLITAKQKVEEGERILRSFILQAPCAMALFRGENYITEIINESTLQLCARKEADLLNRPVFECLPELNNQGIKQLLDNVYQTGNTFSASELPLQVLRNGKLEPLYLNFVLEPLYDALGTVNGIMAVGIDVTHQVMARHKIEDVVTERTKELAEANNNLQRSNAELEQFAYIASHDLQEPARKVNMFTQLLETSLGDINERSRNYLDKITTSSARMQTLIRDVLSYSQLSKKTDTFLPVDLQSIIEDIKTDFELLMEQKSANILYERLPVIEAIPLQMSQLFNNLISNALKFTRPGSEPKIEISSSLLTQQEIEGIQLLNANKMYYNIRVQDNGIGFEPENANQIFNIFQRLHCKTDYAGTGIGLAMCKKIALNHQGYIYATSSLGNGAVFNVILPVKQEEAFIE